MPDVFLVSCVSPLIRSFSLCSHTLFWLRHLFRNRTKHFFLWKEKKVSTIFLQRAVFVPESRSFLQLAINSFFPTGAWEECHVQWRKKRPFLQHHVVRPSLFADAIFSFLLAWIMLAEIIKLAAPLDVFFGPEKRGVFCQVEFLSFFNQAKGLNNVCEAFIRRLPWVSLRRQLWTGSHSLDGSFDIVMGVVCVCGVSQSQVRARD